MFPERQKNVDNWTWTSNLSLTINPNHSFVAESQAVTTSHNPRNDPSHRTSTCLRRTALALDLEYYEHDCQGIRTNGGRYADKDPSYGTLIYRLTHPETFVPVRTPLAKRPLDMIYFAFFLSHIPASLLIDFQALYPPALVPGFVSKLPELYIQMSNDPLIGGALGYMSNSGELGWFRSFLTLEL